MKTVLHHVRINVSDLEKSIRWYEEVMGFEVADRYPAENPYYASFESKGGADFAIQQDSRTPCNGRYNFMSSNLEALWLDLKDKANVIEPLHTTEYGVTKFTISDPDGNELGFTI